MHGVANHKFTYIDPSLQEKEQAWRTAECSEQLTKEID